MLGSNIGNSKKQLLRAISLIQKKIGNINRVSSIYTTAAWGKTDQPDFLNQVVIAESHLSADDVMQIILEIESIMGRVRTKKNAPRIIDIDILFFGKQIIKQKDLIVPHPFIQIRRFVLIPLNELSPNFIHPVLKESNHQLLLKCPDKLDVKKN